MEAILVRRNDSLFFGVTLLSLILLVAVIGPVVSGYRFDEIHLKVVNESPSFLFWMGTDDLGRDIFTRVCYGTRISLIVALSAAVVDLVVGSLWGATAGFFGGRIDKCMMGVADVFYAVPYLLVVLLLMLVLGQGLLAIILALSSFGWITMARIIRGHVLHIKNEEYILASRGFGGSFWHILWTHLLPNVKGPMLVTMTLTIPMAVFSEAYLSFLGLGVRAPMASLGTMASESPGFTLYPWRLFFPALMICLLMFAFNLIGNSLQEERDV